MRHRFLKSTFGARIAAACHIRPLHARPGRKDPSKETDRGGQIQVDSNSLASGNSKTRHIPPDAKRRASIGQQQGKPQAYQEFVRISTGFSVKLRSQTPDQYVLPRSLAAQSRSAQHSAANPLRCL